MTIVSDHVLQLLEPITEELKVMPRLDISDREYQLFWRYHGHFPAEFAAAIDDLDEHSSEDSDDDANMSGMEEVAEKVIDQQQRGRSSAHGRPCRGKSPHPTRR